MTTEPEKQPPCEEKSEESCCEEKWQAQLKRIIFAGIGVLAMAQEEVETLVKKLIQKGTLAEQEGRKWLREILERYKQAKEKVPTVEHSLENVDSIIKKFSLPTKAQFEELSKKVDELTKKVEDLNSKMH